MKILILALSGIGDALMFTPAMQLLRSKLPDAEIDAMVMYKGVKEIYERTNLFDTVHYFDFLSAPKFSSFQFVLKFRGRYEASINVYPSNRKEYNLINFIVGAKKRAAVQYLRSDLPNLGFLNTHRIVENDSLHNVEENILLCEKLFSKKFAESPQLLFPLTKEDELFKEKYLIETGITSPDFVVGFHPGCSTLKNHAKRRWEPDKFARLGNLLVEKKGAKILIFGGTEERELQKLVKQNINSENAFVIKTQSLSQTASIMKRCNVFVTNDSSLMHIASALQLKVVAVIGPTNTNYIYPWKTNHRVASLQLDCAPCFFYSPKPLSCKRDDIQFKCIRELEVGKVFSVIESF
ncbi:MAG: ADP-heptose--LPS heptosyltransferase [Ignavibacteria bacterium CG22_combo_CG10-13_8_21_14_all_37_15]|nr:MAG: ADP-heptose--LPS heptosyltransferase [Ignavibacteria bacterium CG22_combo_CG10-13_8_21_14_all_37_15]